MKYFNRVMDIRRMEADLMNKAIGATVQPVAFVKREARAMSEGAVGPAVKLEAGTAYGAHEKRKGGVSKGAVFISGDAARGRGAAFVTVGGSRLYRNGTRVI